MSTDLSSQEEEDISSNISSLSDEFFNTNNTQNQQISHDDDDDDDDDDILDIQFEQDQQEENNDGKHKTQLLINGLNDDNISDSYSDEDVNDDNNNNNNINSSDQWIDAESITDSLRDLNDPGSILNHFQKLYTIESTKAKQKHREKVRNSNKQIRSFSLSPKHKFNRQQLMRMKLSKDNNNKNNDDIIRDISGNQIFSSEQIHERRYLKRRITETKIRLEQDNHCTFKPEIDQESVGMMQQKRKNKDFLQMVKEDINKRQEKINKLQKEKNKNEMKNVTFKPKINNNYNKDNNMDNIDDVFQRLSASQSPSLQINNKTQKKLKKKKLKHLNKNNNKDITYFASPHRIKQISKRLYGNHEKIQLKKQIYKKNLEKEEENKRTKSKVLNNSRKIIVNAFLTKFENIIQINDKDRIIDNFTAFDYREIEFVLKKIGFSEPEILNGKNNKKQKKNNTERDILVKRILNNDDENDNYDDEENQEISKTDHTIKKLLKLLDPINRGTIKWGDLKRFFRKIASNPTNFNKNKDLYQIIQYLYVNKLLNDKTEKSQHDSNKIKLNKKDFLKKWNKEIEKRQTKMIKNEQLRKEKLENKLNAELSECTFSPQINKKYDINNIGNNDIVNDDENTFCNVPRYEQLYEDAQDRQIRKNEKIIAKELDNYRKYKSYSFKPSINKNNENIDNMNNIQSERPQGFDEAVLRLSEGRIRQKQREIEQEYKQKNLEQMWQRRSQFLKEQKKKKNENIPQDIDQIDEMLCVE